MSAGYKFAITCPYDGAPVEHVAGSASNGWETRAVCRCTECGQGLLVQVAMATASEVGRRTTEAQKVGLARARQVVAA